jgi:hypothetical protein
MLFGGTRNSLSMINFDSQLDVGGDCIDRMIPVRLSRSYLCPVTCLSCPGGFTGEICLVIAFLSSTEGLSRLLGQP